MAGLKPGQTVSLHVDAYPDREFRAHIDSISQASGAEFSVMTAPLAYLASRFGRKMYIGLLSMPLVLLMKKPSEQAVVGETEHGDDLD